MITRRTLPFALALCLPACVAEEDDADDGGAADGKLDDPDGRLDQGIAVSAASVQSLGGELDSVQPPIDDLVIGDGLPSSTYLVEMGPLGPFGPLGPYGPLGVLGPVGTGAWTSSTFIGLAAPWDAFAGALADVDGPLSKSGPLGSKGPLSREYWKAFEQRFAAGEDFVTQLEPGGLFAPLGPVGPLGALGPLGPLGPVGAHGYAADDDGNWRSDDACHHDAPERICRTVDVQWKTGETRTWELFESYREAFAQAMPDNDTSFMVEAVLDADEVDVYPFTSAQLQTVTVVAFGKWTMFPFNTAMALLGTSALIGYATPTIVPGFFFPFNVYDHVASFDDVDLVLEIDVGGETTKLVSDTANMVDWIHVQVPAGARLRAQVSVASRWTAPWRSVDAEYRLFVVGSTTPLAAVNVAGAHQSLVTYAQP